MARVVEKLGRSYKKECIATGLSKSPIFENQNPLYLKIKFYRRDKKLFSYKTKSQKAIESIVFDVASLNALHAIYSQQNLREICQI